LYRELHAEQPGRFDSPRPLPELPAMPGDPVFAEAADRVQVRAVVTRSGRAREVAFVDGVPDGLRIRTRKNLSDTRFRPALNSDGETVKAPYAADLWSMRIALR